jgi:excisionase family DNA binding protein
MELRHDVVLSQIALPELMKAFSNVLDEKLQKIQTPANEEEYLTRKEAAAFLGISVNTLNTYTVAGKINGYRIAGGKCIRFKKPELQQAFKSMNDN